MKPNVNLLMVLRNAVQQECRGVSVQDGSAGKDSQCMLGHVTTSSEVVKVVLVKHIMDP